ncbi:MAG: NADH-quinone oxidoreductase subunit J [Bacilli bacterium]
MDFLSEYYLWFVIGGIILLMALIGYIADKTDFGRKDITAKKSKKEKDKPNKKSEVNVVEPDKNVELVSEVAPTITQPVTDVMPESEPIADDSQSPIDIADIDPFVMPDNNDVQLDNNASLTVNENTTEDEDIEIKEVTDDSTFAFNNDLSSFAAIDTVNPIASADAIDNNIPEVVSEDNVIDTPNNVIDELPKESQDTQETEDDIWKF